MNTCPCGSGASYTDCCQPIHLNPSNALLPEQLMRARYCAHVLGLVDFVIETYHPSCQAEQEREQIAASVQSQWLKLEVLGHAKGAHEDEGFVHFKAHFSDGQQAHCLEENSRFLRHNHRWYYIDGTFPDTPLQPKIGRNDPCRCGSGKKFKKCCG